MKQKSKSSSDLVTKEFLKGGLEVLETKIDIKLDRIERRIDENAQKYRDQILKSNDKLVKEQEGIREDKIIGDHQVKEKLDNYEKRLNKLERVQQAT